MKYSTVAGFVRQGPMNWHLFLGASILIGGLLLTAGAPLPSVLAGIGLAALLHWKRVRTSTPPGSKTGL